MKKKLSNEAVKENDIIMKKLASNLIIGLGEKSFSKSKLVKKDPNAGNLGFALTVDQFLKK